MGRRRRSRPPSAAPNGVGGSHPRRRRPSCVVGSQLISRRTSRVEGARPISRRTSHVGGARSASTTPDCFCGARLVLAAPDFFRGARLAPATPDRFRGARLTSTAPFFVLKAISFKGWVGKSVAPRARRRRPEHRAALWSAGLPANGRVGGIIFSADAFHSDDGDLRRRHRLELHDHKRRALIIARTRRTPRVEQHRRSRQILHDMSMTENRNVRVL